MSLKRKYIQVISALLYNANFKGFAEGKIYQGKIKNVCVPGLNCYSCPGAVGACPLGSFQNAIYSSGKTIPFYIVGTLLLLGVIFGRVICGFLCPFGLIQELIYKIPSPKIKKNKVTKALSKLKYVILVVFVFVLSAIKEYPAFCKYICPQGVLEGAIPLSLGNTAIRSALGKLFSFKLIILIMVILLSILFYRPFCKWICPLGAIYSLFNKISFLSIKVEDDKCVGCHQCTKVCKMDVDVIKSPNHPECIRCGACMKACPKDAIHYQFIKFNDK